VSATQDERPGTEDGWALCALRETGIYFEDRKYENVGMLKGFQDIKNQTLGVLKYNYITD